jgi:hypothetical protein
MDKTQVVNNKLVEFICKCGTNHSKSKRALHLTGPFCKDCTRRNTAIKKIKNKIVINNEMLEKQMSQY